MNRKVTQWAAMFLFGGSALFITILLVMGRRANAMDVFHAVLPVAAVIVALWFRQADKA